MIFRKILIIGLILFITSCKPYKTVITYDNRINTEAEKEIITKVGINKWYIRFTSNYSKNNIKCYQNDSLIWHDDDATTLHTLGAAGDFSISNTEKIKIVIDDIFKIKLKFNKDYPFVYINKTKNTFTIRYSNYFEFLK